MEKKLQSVDRETAKIIDAGTQAYLNYIRRIPQNKGKIDFDSFIEGFKVGYIYKDMIVEEERETKVEYKQ